MSHRHSAVAATPAPAPLRVPPGRGHGAEIDVDALDALSRSLPTGGAMLDPEPSEYAMLRPSRSNTAVLEAVTDEDEDGLAETEPLLRQRTASTARSTASGHSSPFLDNTSTGRFWFIFAQLLASQFIACFDGTIMASSHPVITSYFGAANSASWLSTAFLLTSTAFQPLLGRLSDAVGRKPLYVACLVVFLISTCWCALAGSIESFIMARAACGLGAGGSMTLGTIIVSDLVPIERRGTYQSYINITYGVGSALGAALGGALAEGLGWRWEFGVQIPPLIVICCVALVAIPANIGVQDGRKSVWTALREFDAKGSLLLTISITFFILGLNFGGNVLPWSHPFVIASLAIFGVFFPAFIIVESRVSRPIMPLYLIQNHPRANLIFANFIASLIGNSIMFNIPLYFQAVLLTSATSSGLRLIVPSVVSSATGAVTGLAIAWTRRLKWPVLSGTLFYLVATVCLSLLRRDLHPLVYVLMLVPFSLGQGFQFPGTFIAVLAVGVQSEQAVVTSTLILWRSLGMVLGVASSSLVVQNALVHYLDIYVQGEYKEDVITRVRASVEAVAQLEEPYREQVVVSYEAALRLTFICCAVLAAVSVLIVLPMKLPRLPARKR